MGTCYNCNVQVTLKDEETKCDNCGVILRYWCNTCKQAFDVEDEITNKKLNECKTCSFFYCPNCGVCSPDCEKREWAEKIKEILGNHFYSTLNGTEILQKIIQYIEEIKLRRDRKTCPKGVPITYAKNRIKSIFVRMKGFRVKSIQDQKAFELKLTELSNLNVGKQITISQIREEGSYGQEYRDVLNYCLCLGLFKVTYKLNEQKKEYALFERTEGEGCKFLDIKNLITRQCKICNKIYSTNVTQCTCVRKQGKNKGINYSTHIKISNKDTCQLYRSDFNKKEKNDYD